MTRWLGLGFVFFVAHLLEEAATRMYDDPLIVSAFAPLAHLSARHATYSVMQLTMAVALGAALLFSMGGLSRLFVTASLAFAMLCESHHVIRAIATLHYNSGLLTSIPVPVLGIFVLRTVFARTDREAVTS